VYRHLIFDLDGTLIDSRADLAAAVNHALHLVGLPQLAEDVVTGFIGEGARVLVGRAVSAAGDPARLQPALDAFLEFYRQHLLDHTRLYAGMLEALQALRLRGARLSVLSNKPESMSRAILGGLGVAAQFTAFVGGDTLPRRKPDPDGVRHLLQLTSTSPPEAVLIGDSLIDLQTARTGGIDFRGVEWGLRPAELRAAGAAMITHPSELVALVNT